MAKIMDGRIGCLAAVRFRSVGRSQAAWRIEAFPFPKRNAGASWEVCRASLVSINRGGGIPGGRRSQDGIILTGWVHRNTGRCNRHLSGSFLLSPIFFRPFTNLAQTGAMVAGFGDGVGGDRFRFAALTADLQSPTTRTGDAGVALPLVARAGGLLEVVRCSDIDGIHLARSTLSGGRAC